MKAAIIPAKGLGDGLIMLLSAEKLLSLGYEVFFFHTQIKSFSPWFKNIIFKSSIEDHNLENFDIIFLENDNSKKSKIIISSKKLSAKRIFYPTYKKGKHFPLKKNDYIFDPSISMVENISNYFNKFFNLPKNKNIDFIIPKHLKHKKHIKRIVIHPTSNDPLKNYSKKKYLKIAKKLKKLGYDPVFILKEKKWKDKNIPYPMISFNDISSLANFIYESSFFIGNDSGPAHLASLLKIPLIVITNDKKRIKLWQPGWQKASIFTPPSYIPNIKGLKLREKKWQHFICTKKIIKTLLKKHPLQPKDLSVNCL